MSPATKDIVVLPKERNRDVPSEGDKRLWFEKFPPSDFLGRDFEFNFNCERGLVVAGIGESDCPISSEWASFVIAGAIVAALSGKYIAPREDDPWWESDLTYFIWEALWPATVQNPDKLDKSFLAAMLRDLLPRFHSSPPFSSYTRSLFSSHWLSYEYTDTVRSRIGNLRLKVIKEERKALETLPQPVVDSIHLVAQHVPPMLEIVNKHEAAK